MLRFDVPQQLAVVAETVADAVEDINGANVELVRCDELNEAQRIWTKVLAGAGSGAGGVCSCCVPVPSSPVLSIHTA